MSPLIFIDDGSRALLPLDVLAGFPIVLISYNRFTPEWKNGSVEQEIRAPKKGSSSDSTYWGDDVPKASSLLKVSWLWQAYQSRQHNCMLPVGSFFPVWITAQRTVFTPVLSEHILALYPSY